MDATSPRADVDHSFVPGLGRLALTPFYDVVHRLAGLQRLHRVVIDAARPEPGHRVLDVGCGTGNLLLSLGRAHPGVGLVGLDPDFAALARAQRKSARAGIGARWEHGFGESLPFPDDSFDRVLSTLMLHHLDPGTKDALLAGIGRVLRPGGVLVLADVDGDDAVHGHGPLGRRMAGSERLRANSGLAGLVEAAGLLPDPVIRHRSRFGVVSVVRATA